MNQQVILPIVDVEHGVVIDTRAGVPNEIPLSMQYCEEREVVNDAEDIELIVKRGAYLMFGLNFDVEPNLFEATVCLPPPKIEGEMALTFDELGRQFTIASLISILTLTPVPLNRIHRKERGPRTSTAPDCVKTC